MGASLRERLAGLSSARGGLAAGESHPLSSVAAECRAGVAVREEVFPLRSRRWLPRLRDADTRGLALVSRLDSQNSSTPDWLFLDVETTGLAGGTGTYAFLVGLGWLMPEGFCVRQFFLRDLAAERELLEQLAATLSGRRLLVTYNGKLFDAPLLDTRFRLARRPSPLEGLPHFDLVYPARRLWKLRCGSARLLELERALLGHARTDDVPGVLIPKLYFDFLRRGNERRLEPVFRHNADDLLTLAALAARVTMLAAAPETEPEESLERVGLARLFERADESLRAAALYEQALTDHLPTESARSAQLRLSFLYKRRHDHQRAAALWRALSGDDSPADRIALIALEQLAICYEHRLGDAEKAAHATRQALRALDSVLATERAERHARLARRLERLQRKQPTALLSWSKSPAGGL